MEASADDRDRRAFTSMMQYSSLSGFSVSRSIMYSRFVSVCDGATTIESPVWMPSGSKFSMLHTVTQLS